MTEVEKIARLEQRLERAECDIIEIKNMFMKATEESRKTEINYAVLTGQLATLTENLKTHNEWHKENGQKKFSITNTILAVGMLLIAIFQIYQASVMTPKYGFKESASTIVKNEKER